MPTINYRRESSYPPSLRRKLDNPPQSGSGKVHEHLLSLAQQLRHYESNPDVAHQVMLETALRAGRSEREAAREVARIMKGWSGNSSTVVDFQRQPALPKPDLDAIDQIVRTRKETLAAWESRSQRVEGADVAGFLVDLLLPNAIICIGKEAHDAWCNTHEQFTVWGKSLSEFSFIVPNPMRECGVWVPGEPSPRRTENVLRRDWCVLEWDFKELNDDGTLTIWAELLRQWCADGIDSFTAQSRLIAEASRHYRQPHLIIHSGSKSLHAWFSALSEQHTDDFTRRAIELGADSACRNKSQFFRMPSGTRNNGGRQRVVYASNELVF